MKLSRKLFTLICFCLLFIGVVHDCEADEPPKVTDGQIIGIALVTYDSQIAGSQYALPLIYYWDLKNFAQAMVIDYQNYRNTVLDVSSRERIPPEDSQIAQEIAKRGQEAMETLKKLQGRELEKTYADYEIELHVKTLQSIRDIFLPNVENWELQKLIRQVKPIIEGRLDWIRKIRATYGN